MKLQESASTAPPRAFFPAKVSELNGGKTTVLNVDGKLPDLGAIEQAAAIIRAGGLVAFPTETVYGLGANALDPNSVGKIFAAKGRPANNPIIVHVSGIEMARQLVADWPESAAGLAERFWPGPLTFVLARSEVVPDIVTAGGPTVALRRPAHAVAEMLIRAAGLPIAAPSANRSGELSPTLAEHVLRRLDGRIDLILDGGPTKAGIESSVIDLSGDKPRLLRPGPISPAEVEALIGPIERTVDVSTQADAALPSPGMLARHYSPSTTLECFASAEALERRARELSASRRQCAIVVVDDEGLAAFGHHLERLPAAPEAFAAALYQVLHKLDQGDFARILVLLPPDEERWLAVRDRLRRAGLR
jgi:L-threonylcarbamoyladenylate synthase